MTRHREREEIENTQGERRKNTRHWDREEKGQAIARDKKKNKT